MVTAVCPECRHVLSVPTRYEGRWWRCPDCRAGFRAPTEDRLPPAPASIRMSSARPHGAVRSALARLVALIRGA